MSQPSSAVWKYELDPGVTVLDLPVGAVPLTVAEQAGGVYLWVLVPAERDTRDGMAPVPTERRAFLSAGTGHRHHPAWFGRYIGTAFIDALVFHVFETGLPA